MRRRKCGMSCNLSGLRKINKMKPLIVLMTAFIISLVTLQMGFQKYAPALSARIAMSVMLLFTASGHFAFTKGMSLMVPHSIPFRIMIIYLTGIFEILAAIGLVIPDVGKWTAWALILFLIVTLPANIYAALHRVNYEKATFDGKGRSYLWFRIPLQLFFILWILFSVIIRVAAPPHCP
jgi:uncharacterized membrane protein